MNIDLELLTKEIEKIAIEGGSFLRDARKHFQSERVENKHPHDFVSYVDRECEKLLVERLHALVPQAGFITEEDTVNDILKKGSESSALKWVIDPLDGTTNFIRNNAPYCVCIALEDEEELLIGVVYEVCREELYSAYKDGPALLNGEPIHVSAVNNPNEAYITLELPYNVDDYKATGSAMYQELYGTSVCLRMSGSAAASLCYVAAGRMDVWFESYIGYWDYSAAALIVRQAGGRVTNFRGSDNIMRTNNIIGTNGLLHHYISGLLEKCLPPHLKN